jgi:hypothetical protein
MSMSTATQYNAINNAALLIGVCYTRSICVDNIPKQIQMTYQALSYSLLS